MIKNTLPDALQVVLFTVLWLKWSVKKSCIAKVLLAIWEAFFHEHNHNFILTDVITNSPLSFFFAFSYKPKVRIRFLASWW